MPSAGRHRGSALVVAVIFAALGMVLAASASATTFAPDATLTPSDALGKSLLGSAVAVDRDGDTALVGGPLDNNGIGAAWVFKRKHDKWTEQAKLTGEGEIGAGQFGTSVALSSDGKTALIGGPKDNSGIGGAWVFTRAGSTWRQRGAKLVGKDVGGGAEEVHCEGVEGELEEYCFVGHPAEFGTSVALSSNGNTALIGAPGDNEHDGAVWVFARAGASWRQQGEKLTGGSEEGFNYYGERRHHGFFGKSVALSADGRTALIGVPGDDDEAGAAWVFTRSGSAWIQQGPKLTTGIGASRCSLGESVALSADGNTALIGEPGGFHCSPGDAFVFTRTNAMWTQQATLTGECLTDRCYDGGFGASVALSSGGSTALIGAQEHFARVFTRSDEAFTQQLPTLACEGQGCDVALSGDATTALVGTAVYVNSTQQEEGRQNDLGGHGGS